MRYLIVACTLLFISIVHGEVTITPEQQLKLDMEHERDEMEFASECKLAIDDPVFCECLADKAGAITFGSFWIYAKAMSLDKTDVIETNSFFKVALGDDELTTKFMSYLPVFRKQCREQAAAK